MPSKQQAKVKIINKSNKDVAKMFGEMLGAGDTVNISVCYPKYKIFVETITNTTKIIDLLANTRMFDRYNDEIGDWVKEISEYTKKARLEIDTVFKYDLPLNELVPSEKTIKEFSAVYDKAKKTYLIRDYIAVCDGLIADNKHLSADPPSADFLLHHADIEYTPFKFSKFDLKRLMILIETDDDLAEDRCSSLKSYIASIMAKMFNNTHKLYKTYSKPDIDVKEFANAVSASLGEVRKNISGCDDAFRKIEQSVHLLEDNFDTYYRDFLSTQNQTIIMQDFVIDVAKSTKADMKTTSQFRKIVSYYRQVSGNKIKDPRIRKLIDQISGNIDVLDSNDNIKQYEKQDDCDSDSSADPFSPEHYTNDEANDEASDEASDEDEEETAASSAPSSRND